MRKYTLFVLTMLVAAAASAQQVTIREIRQTSMAAPAVDLSASTVSPRPVMTMALPPANNAVGPVPFTFYPVAGTFGKDLFIAYYVDLDPTPGLRDLNCGKRTYDGSTGEDPFIRSFAEQDIGVPVFAALDGVVIGLHDGEPDRNTDSNPTKKPNVVTIQHSDDQSTTYEHLRNGILVSVGNHVTAGTQIGWVGSSGNSPGPHIHFESDWNGQAYEPMAGPCRPGLSNFLQQPQIPTAPYLVGAFFSPYEFTSVPPNDDSLHTGTFAAGQQTFFAEATLANVAPGASYTASLRRPSGNVIPATFKVGRDQEEMLTIQWAISAPLLDVGTWNLLIDVDGVRVATLPFNVVPTPNQIFNHAPNLVSVSIDPITAGDVAICHANSGLVADPDYDVVSYMYQWQVNGATVRNVKSAASIDVLARQFTTFGASVNCTVTVSDGRQQNAPVTAFADVRTRMRHRVSR
ncbi:MAG: M23 family metallopeptidase [Acidobacteriota bacterium]|nr:M23 family metallopeptidase [Acidobacteriota bacterium]